jgi:hypothetical protein
MERLPSRIFPLGFRLTFCMHFHTCYMSHPSHPLFYFNYPSIYAHISKMISSAQDLGKKFSRHFPSQYV